MPNASRTATAEPLPLWRHISVLDVALLGVIATFAVWVALGPGQRPVDVAIDYGTFTAIGLLVAVVQWQAAMASTASSEQRAWRLLAMSSIVRAGSGVVWSVWIVDHPGQARPAWALALSATSLLLVLAGLLAFGGEPRRALDRRRQVIDGIIVLVGSATALWFAALAPFAAATGAQEPRFEDYVYLLSDSASALVAALLVLRRSQRHLRRTATLLLLAALLQTVPDVLLWAGKANFSYRPGDALAVLWFTVWVLKGAAARYALHVARHPTDELTRTRDHYESGVVPTAFVLAASAVLVIQLSTAPQESKLPLVVSVGVLSLMLVLRQLIEIREQERVRRSQSDEAQWYGAVLRDSNDYVMVLDADGNSLDMSPAARRLVDGTANMSRWALMGLVHPEDQLALRQALGAARDAPASLEIRVPDDIPGSWRQLALTIIDRRHDEDAGAILLHAYDTTREVQLSMRLRQTEELEALGVFAGGLAHDLNNILTVIDAHAEILEEDLKPNLTLMQDIAAIRVASQRAQRFTRGLLTLSRRKQSREVDLDVVAVLRARVVFAGLEHRVVLHCPDGPLLLRTDQGACHLAIDSLLLAVLESEPSDQSGVVQLRALVHDVGRYHADALNLEPGRYLRLELEGLAEGLALRAAEASAWEGSAAQLALLLADAAARELGGLQRVDADGVVQTYLPMGASE
ncbi:histidine kinase dimerization/phospho-acceptor domain-containing protein [Gemmatimonas sp.]